MEKRSEQQRVNLDIAYELDKYQVMLEYGRLFLDRDKAIRDKYKWMSYVKSGCLSGTLLDTIFAIITAIISAETFTKWLPFMLVVLLLLLITYIFFLYTHRKAISKLLSKADIVELDVLLNNLQKYLYQLGEWMKTLDSHIVQANKLVSEIDKSLAVAKSNQADDVNKLSRIYGSLDEAMYTRAHEIASARLQQFKQYTYKYEQDSQSS